VLGGVQTPWKYGEIESQELRGLAHFGAQTLGVHQVSCCQSFQNDVRFDGVKTISSPTFLGWSGVYPGQLSSNILRVDNDACKCLEGPLLHDIRSIHDVRNVLLSANSITSDSLLLT
jgi:hypothetical protein